MNLSIIIPVYNEEKNIAPLYKRIKTILNTKNYSYEIIFVNDGSSDSTNEELEKIQKKDTSLRTVHLSQNKGLSRALEAGFSEAKGDIIVSLDGDMQNSPEEIPRLIEKLSEGYDTVCGWRHKRKDPVFMKKIPSKLFNTLLRLLFNTPVHDNSCTLRAYKSKMIKNLKLKDGMHRFIPVILCKQGGIITEIKVSHNPRIRDKPKYNSPLRFLKTAKNMIELKQALC